MNYKITLVVELEDDAKIDDIDNYIFNSLGNVVGNPEEDGVFVNSITITETIKVKDGHAPMPQR